MARKLSKTKLAKFTKLFNERKLEIHRKVAQNDLEVDNDGDDIDLIQARQLHEMASHLSNRDLDMLSQIEAALERIKAGSFGLCEECDEPIGEKRLAARPQCTLCIDCQEDAEKLKKQFS